MAQNTTEPTKDVIREFTNFRVTRTVDATGYEDRRIELHGEALINWLRENVRIEDIYDDLPEIETFEMFNILETIKYRANRTNELPLVTPLVEFLEEENRNVLGRLRNMLDNGQMSFALLKGWFTPGTEIAIHDDEAQGGRVIECQYKRTFFGNFLDVKYEYIGTDGREFRQYHDNVSIAEWSGVKAVDHLQVRPLDAATRRMLEDRGRIFAKVAVGAHYMQFNGQMQIKKWWSWNNMRADGRIMTDPVTYAQFVDEYTRGRDDENSHLRELDADRMWMTEPYIRGFSFFTKQWGRFAVSRISDIAFSSNAFDQLVLAQDKKDLIRALVTNGTGGFTDIISGKGGGCIFLLHGEPGVGKTLTAEAIAELLQRPLYSVSVGELGVSADELERKLRQILDVAQIWDAVILIDEADIFLEKRGHDIIRSAMTSVFLRLSEYHQGVLFLTTNRVKTFDPAFYSRISIALKYGELQVSAREQIWTNLLVAAGIEGLDPAELAKIEINGRQIKTTIRLAQGLARQEGVKVQNRHVMQVVDISRQFLEDISESE